MPNSLERGQAAKHSTCTSLLYRVVIEGRTPEAKLQFTYLTPAFDAIAAENRALKSFRASHPSCAIRKITVGVAPHYHA